MEELKNKLYEKQSKNEALKILFEWCKTNHISLKQFIELDEYVNKVFL